MDTSPHSPSPLAAPTQAPNGNGYRNGNGQTPQPLQMIPLSPWSYPSQEEAADFDLIGLLNTLRRRAFIFLGVATIVSFGAWTRTLMQTPIYEGSFRILVEAVSSDPPISQLITQNQSELDYATQIQVLQSPEILQTILKEIQVEYPQVTIGNLTSSLLISRLNDTKILEIKYRNSNQSQIQSVLEHVAQGYLDYSLKERQTSLRQGISFVEEQLPEMRQRVNALQQMIQDLQQNYNFIDPQLRTQELTVQLSQLSQSLLEIDHQLVQAESQYQGLQNVPGATIALRNDSIYQQQLSQVQAVENQIALELARSRETSLEIQALERQRNNLLPLLNQGAESALNMKLNEAAQIISNLQDQQSRIQSQGAQLQAQIRQMPALSRVFNELQQELEVARQSLNRLLAARESLQLESAQKEIPWQLLVAPQTSNRPISPNVSRNLFSGVMLGLVLGVGTALLIDRLDNVFHSIDQLQEDIKAPMLGVIPFSPELADAQNAIERKQTQTEGLSKLLTEAVRSLAINLRLMGADSPIRSLVISSAMPADGKSTVSLHLAKAAAAMGQRVLLVDADLRRPKLHRRLSLFNGQGLANLITNGDIPIDNVIQPSGLEDKLWVLTSGQRPPDPSRLLSSETMKRLNQTLQSSYDLVIYDTPPLLGLSDASLLSNLCDGLMLVVGLGQTDRGALKRSLENIKTGRAPLLGVVVNAVKQNPGSRYYDYYYYSYGYHQYYRGAEALEESDS
ncbi:MAG: GumC family protein [Prochlorotrichaceae cyanobacterium]